MFVWATWCRKKALCRRCGVHVTTGEKMIKCQYYVKRRRYMMYFHFDCWVANAQDWFTTHPYQKRPAAANCGRPKLKITDETRAMRLKLQQHKAKAVQDKKKAAMKLPDKKAVKRLELLDSRIQGYDNWLNLLDKEVDKDATAESI